MSRPKCPMCACEGELRERQSDGTAIYGCGAAPGYTFSVQEAVDNGEIVYTIDKFGNKKAKLIIKHHEGEH